VSQIKVWHDSRKGWRIFIPGDGNSRLPLEAVEQIQLEERERILGLRKEIINCVINYGLMPEQYERVMNDIEKVIKGETE
jgi:hypothetical protein